MQGDEGTQKEARLCRRLGGDTARLPPKSIKIQIHSSEPTVSRTVDARADSLTERISKNPS